MFKGGKPLTKLMLSMGGTCSHWLAAALIACSGNACGVLYYSIHIKPPWQKQKTHIEQVTSKIINFKTRYYTGYLRNSQKHSNKCSSHNLTKA